MERLDFLPVGLLLIVCLGQQTSAAPWGSKFTKDPCAHYKCPKLGQKCVVFAGKFPACVCKDATDCPLTYQPTCDEKGEMYPNGCFLDLSSCAKGVILKGSPCPDDGKGGAASPQDNIPSTDAPLSTDGPEDGTTGMLLSTDATLLTDGPEDGTTDMLLSTDAPLSTDGPEDGTTDMLLSSDAPLSTKGPEDGTTDMLLSTDAPLPTDGPEDGTTDMLLSTDWSPFTEMLSTDMP